MTEWLSVDPSRQADDSIRGFAYQVWQSVRVWIDLEEDERLYLEGAEDIDVVRDDSGSITQVKDTPSQNLSLNRKVARFAIENFLACCQANPERALRYVFLTTAAPNVERGSPFGKGKTGIELWSEIGRGPYAPAMDVDIERIASVLLRRDAGAKTRELLSRTPQSIHAKLISRLTWAPRAPRIEAIREIVRQKLVLHGDRFGFLPSDAGRAASVLFQHALNAAFESPRPALSRGDFLQAFEQATCVSIPVSLMRSPVMAPATTLQRATRAHNLAAPPLPSEVVARRRLRDEVRDALQRYRVAWLWGGSGVGKSVIATQAADWVGAAATTWVHLRDLTDAQAASLLALIRSELGYHDRTLLVLDDLSVEHQSDVVARSLPVLESVLREIGGWIVVTSYRPPPEGAGLRYGSEAAVKVGGFDEVEIGVALQQRGASTTAAATWSKVVLVHTSGHPQLVTAYATYLARRSFSLPSEDDIFQSPRELQDTREQAWSFLIKRYEAGDRELLARLDAVIGEFSRDRALAIGAFPPAIERPGEAFESVSRIWLERLGPDTYRLSPIVAGFGRHVLAQDRLGEFKALYASALLKSSALTPQEWSSLFLLAPSSTDPSEILVRACYGYLRMDSGTQAALARHTPWLAHAWLDRPPPSDDSITRALLRLVQTKVARIVDVEAVDALLDLLEAEIPAYPSEANKQPLRQRILLELCADRAEAVPAEKALRWILEFRWLAEKLRARTIPTDAPELVVPNAADTDDFAQMLLLRQEYSGDDIAELFAAIDRLPADERSDALGLFDSDTGPLRLLVTMPWVREQAKVTPDYDGCVSGLLRALNIAASWSPKHWQLSVVRAAATILDESLESPEKALRLVEDATESTGATPALEDCHARILTRQKRFAEALEIWLRILPTWSSRADNAPSLAAREAAIAAAHLSRWEQAADLFREAAQRARFAEREPLAYALEADAAFASWKAGRVGEALDLFLKVVRYLEVLPQESTQLQEYWLHKIVGHTLAWCAGAVATGFEEPPAGSASQGAPSPNVTDLPPTPIDAAKLLLLRCAGASPEWSSSLEIASELLGAGDSGFSLVAAHHIAFRSIENEAYGELGEICKRLLGTGSEVQEPQTDAEGNDAPAETIEFAELVVFLLVVGLTKLITTSRPVDVQAVVERWYQEFGDAPPTVREFLHRVQMLCNENVAGLRRAIASGGVGDYERLIARLLIARFHDSTPADLFLAQVAVVVSLASQQVTRSVLRASFSDWVRRTWADAGCWRIHLYTPSVTVDEILDAVGNARDDWASICRILLAAQPAVGVRLSSAVHEMLVKLQVGSEGA